MSIPLHCRVKERTKLDSKTEYKTYKNYLTMEHYERIAVVRYLDKLRKIEGCILLNSKLEICKNYMKEDFRGEVLVCFRDYTRHFWFKYSFYDDYCTENKYLLINKMSNLQAEILNNWEEIVAGTYKCSTRGKASRNSK